MPRHIKFGLIVLGIGFVAAFGSFVNVIGRIQSMVNDNETEGNPFRPPAPPLYKPTDPPLPVKIFFPAAGGEGLLGAEDQSIFQSSEIENRAKQILQKLQEGPRSEGLTPSLPKDTKVDDLFFSSQGIAYVDFSNTISTNFTGGVLNELATIYSIVNSLTYNLPEIKQVKILIGGTEKETLAGHCLLLLPLSADLSLSNVLPRDGPEFTSEPLAKPNP